MKVFIYCIISVILCSCATSIVKKRYSRGYTLFHHSGPSHGKAKEVNDDQRETLVDSDAHEVKGSKPQAGAAAGKIIVIAVGLFLLAVILAFIFILLILTGGSSSTLTPGFWWMISIISAAIILAMVKVATA